MVTSGEAGAGQSLPVDRANEQNPGGSHKPGGHRGPFLSLTVGAIGVVFGDIGTSPLYAMREALARVEGAPEGAVLGVLSLIFWALILVVTVKYVVFLMRADNKGEGGTLALMALAQHAIGRRSALVFFLGLCGAALFYADGVLTPAVSVLSAVEGLREAPVLGRTLSPFVLPITVGILVTLFLVQSRGTAGLARAFGPITAVWFLILAGLGVFHIFNEPAVLWGLSPHHGARFLIENGFLGFVILGSVFLAVTGAEALYTDMGHFGKSPIRAGWLFLVLPCLMLNYLGQGALALSQPEAAENLFWMMVPEIVYWPILVMATLATIIASQAVITGAFSITGQAVQLGLLPRLNIRRTSETEAGQIYVPSINIIMLAGVLLLLAMFPASSRLAGAYGVAVTGAMLVDTLLAFFILRFMWKRSLPVSLVVLAPFALIDLSFFGSNLLKVPQGAWAPLAIGAGIVLIMWTWTRGSQLLAERARRDSLSMEELASMLHKRPPPRTPGTAIFLTSDPEIAPVALMHNLKHNRVLHQQNFILTVKTADRPHVPPERRIEIAPLNEDFKRLTITYGFMETPNIPKALALCRKQGLKFDIMATSFFLGRRSVVPTPHGGMPLWQDQLYLFLMRNAANPTDFFHIPPGRVVEMGTQVKV
ncbi:potassium transporter Kup [Phenylobacterium sp.]|uniref:potassium transporter Kup n=1 Tax=Phenylobacterium sp. TaxID=1871053 RepID=UPI0028A0C0E7|nr:potassium transporter Kup [Phenylobacterium sp.]